MVHVLFALCTYAPPYLPSHTCRAIYIRLLTLHPDVWTLPNIEVDVDENTWMHLRWHLDAKPQKIRTNDSLKYWVLAARWQNDSFWQIPWLNLLVFSSCIYKIETMRPPPWRPRCNILRQTSNPRIITPDLERSCYNKLETFEINVLKKWSSIGVGVPEQLEVWQCTMKTRNKLSGLHKESQIGVV